MSPLRLALIGSAVAAQLALSACAPYPTAGGALLARLGADGKKIIPISISQVRRYPTVIAPGDNLRITYDYPQGSEPQLAPPPTYQVQPDGTFAFPLIGRVAASDRLPEAVAAEISQRLAKYLAKPQVTVNIAASPADRVFVDGEVRRTGPINLAGGLTLQQAITYAGGLLNTADPENIVLVRETPKGVYDVYIIDDDYIFGPAKNRKPLWLARGDLIIAPPSTTGEVLNFVDLYINRLFGVRGTTVGAVYNINPSTVPTTAILP